MKSREEIIKRYDGKKASVIILETVLEYSDEVIKQIIRDVDNVVLTRALSGASGQVCKRFLANMSDKLLPFIDEEITNCVTIEKEIAEAQEEILKMCEKN